MNGQDHAHAGDDLRSTFIQEISRATEQMAAAMLAFAAKLERDVETKRPLVLAVDEKKTDLNGAEYKMDLALLQAAPVKVVPKYSAFEPLAENGHRFLIADDGMYIEVRRPWLYFVHRLAAQESVAMPFGHIKECTELKFGRIGAALPHIQKFVDAARRELPNEWGDVLVWNDQDQKFTDDNVRVLDKSPAALRYECRDLDDHESVAIDLHSHGHMQAFFSGTDDADDAGSVKISGVVGNLDTDTPTVAFRLCVLGLYLPITVPVDRLFGRAG